MTNKFLFRMLLTIVALMTGCDREKEKSSVEVKTDNIVNSEPEDPSVQFKRIKLKTSMGDIVIELNQEKAPITVENFLRYTEEDFYDGTVFHRVISNFMIQGGGLAVDMARKETHPPIVNEAKNGLKNDRGTITMARTNNPDSATSQFFINHKNNDFLNYAGPDKPGYTVFGKVVEGMEVVDKIAAVETTILRGMRDVPVKPVVIKSAGVIPEKKD